MRRYLRLQPMSSFLRFSVATLRAMVFSSILQWLQIGFLVHLLAVYCSIFCKVEVRCSSSLLKQNIFHDRFPFDYSENFVWIPILSPQDQKTEQPLGDIDHICIDIPKTTSCTRIRRKSVLIDKVQKYDGMDIIGNTLQFDTNRWVIHDGIWWCVILW